MAEAPSYLRYSPDIERPEPDEAATGQALAETMRSIAEKTFADGGHALRSVHAKSHGFLQGELEVVPGLPQELAQGLFAAPGRYPVVLRFSTIPGDILDDRVSTPRGAALKVVGVAGERLEGSEGAATQDFVLVNSPAFGTPTAKQFLPGVKLLAKTTDRAAGLKKAASFALRGVQRLIVAATGGPSPIVSTLGGHPRTHILGDSFYSQAPIRFGDYVAKVALVPVSPELTALTDAPLPAEGGPDAIRAAVVAFFRATGATWELRAQLCTDLATMPVENAATVWPEAESPYRTVARVTAGPQTAWSEARAARVDDGMAFSPWQGLAAHRPLGSIMRVRKQAYAMGARFRAERNGRTMEEPRAFSPLPD